MTASGLSFLLTNDDGSHAPGLVALARVLRELGEVTVVAPDREMSGIGHAITLHTPLRIRRNDEGFHIVDGTPTDCVNIGVLKILGTRPSFVVAGVNRGGNLGDDVTYSGTVAGAMEGALLDVPSVAVSLVSGHGAPPEERTTFEDAARAAAAVIRKLAGKPFPQRTLLNVNVPGKKPLKEAVVTRQGRRTYSGGIVEKTDPRGKTYFWIGGEPVWESEEGTDQVAVSLGHVSVTPLHLDLTDTRFLPDLTRLLGS